MNYDVHVHVYKVIFVPKLHVKYISVILVFRYFVSMTAHIELTLSQTLGNWCLRAEGAVILDTRHLLTSYLTDIQCVISSRKTWWRNRLSQLTVCQISRSYQTTNLWRIVLWKILSNLKTAELYSLAFMTISQRINVWSWRSWTTMTLFLHYDVYSTVSLNLSLSKEFKEDGHSEWNHSVSSCIVMYLYQCGVYPKPVLYRERWCHWFYYSKGNELCL
jgi:hypothetical protein